MLRRHSVRHNLFYLVLIRLIFLLLLVPSIPVNAAEPVKIGILAFRPKSLILAQWQPLAIALKLALPDHDFEIQVFTYPELNIAIAKHQLDFILTNSGHYVLLSKHYPLSAPLATLAFDNQGKALNVFGGVIFSKADAANVTSLIDLKGKTIAITDTQSLGGYQLQAYELKQANIHLPQDAKLLITGMPHDNVVNEVLAGHAEAGFVRTGVLEAMAHEGKLNLNQIKILNSQNLIGFPGQVSTRLYPEWPFVALPHVDENLARHVAAALFVIEENTSATHAMGIHGFIIPADYTSVTDMLRELRMPPFDDVPEFTFQDVWSRYYWQLFSAMLASLIILLLTASLLLMNRRLKHKRIKLESETRLRNGLLNSLGEGVYGVDELGMCIFVNPVALKMLGYSEAEMIGKDQHALFHYKRPDGTPYPKQECLIYKTLEDGRSRNGEETFWTKEGTGFSIALTVTANEVGVGRKGAVVVFQDISERKQAEFEIKKSLSLLTATLESTTDAMLVVDTNNVWRLYNQHFVDLWHIPDEIVASKDDRVALSYVLNQVEDAEGFVNKVKELYASPKENSFDTLRFKNGKIVERFSLPQYIDGEVVGRVWSFRDVTDRKQMEEQVFHLAYYDALTKLPNRRLLLDRLNLTIASSKRTGLFGALMFIDLDNFKPINDNYGHGVGDLLLIEVANRLKYCIRETDTVARFGGDEFVVMLNELGVDKAVANTQSRIIAEKILLSLSEPYFLDNSNHGIADEKIVHHCTASIGVAVFANHASTLDDILKWADSAMYQAKESGRNQIRFYEAGVKS